MLKESRSFNIFITLLFFFVFLVFLVFSSYKIWVYFTSVRFRLKRLRLFYFIKFTEGEGTFTVGECR